MSSDQAAITLAGAQPGDLAVGIEGLLRFGEQILTKAGAPLERARLTTEILLEADLRGIESHGVAHLVDFYVRAIQDGLIDPHAKIELVRETASAGTIDAGAGLGFVAGHDAMSRAVEKARETGVGIVTVGNSTHFGAGTYYGMMALEHDMIGLSMTTGGRLMAAPGALAQTTGTNVISCSAPAPRGYPYVLDMATTVVAAGKLEIAERRGRSIPEGWAIDGEGKPLTDPTRRNLDAMLLPLGTSEATSSYKGFGLALMVDVLAGALSGFVTSAEMERWRAAHAFGALRIDAFQPLDEFLDRMGRMIDAIKAQPTRDGVDSVRIPGEVEHQLAEERRTTGVIPLHPKIVEGYHQAAEELGVPCDLEETPLA